MVLNKMMENRQACRGVVDEGCGQWITFKARRCATRPKHVLSHTHVRGQRCETLTTLRIVCVRRGVLSSAPVACTTVANVSTRNL